MDEEGWIEVYGLGRMDLSLWMRKDGLKFME